MLTPESGNLEQKDLEYKGSSDYSNVTNDICDGQKYPGYQAE